MYRYANARIFNPVITIFECLQAQDEIAETLKAEAGRTRPSRPTTTVRSTTAKVSEKINSTMEDSAMKKLFEAEDMPYEDDLSEDEEDESEGGEYDEDSEDENDDELDDDEQVMTQCPDHCRCAGEYAAATTAT